MHNVLFGVKRTFHKSTWFGRAILAPYELTPSRFDILYILHRTTIRPIWQSHIRKIVGVTAATSSIMMRALVKLGLVERKRSELDRRQLEISLTERGRALITRALATLFTQKLVPFFVRRLVSSTWWDAERAFEDIDQLTDSLHFMRDRMGDTARLLYGAHPDD